MGLKDFVKSLEAGVKYKMYILYIHLKELFINYTMGWIDVWNTCWWFRSFN